MSQWKMFRSQSGEGKSHIVTQGPIWKKGKREATIQPLRHQGTNSNCKFSIVNFQLFVPWWLPEQLQRENNKDRIDLVISDIIMQVVERSSYEGNMSKS
jgi:hypothetical protein